MSATSAYFWVLRPRQWVKNLFVLAPLVFSKHLLEPWLVLRSVAGCALFCAISGVVYIINDLRDVEADRHHPVKKKRPIAAGVLRQRSAMIFAGVLAALAFGGGVALDWVFGGLLLAYLVLNFVYTVGLKKVPYLDVASIATGFLLRVLAGAAVLDVRASTWLIICTGLLAAFLGFGKRASELTALGEEAGRHRPVLKKYRLGHLKIALVIFGLATLAAYAAYTVSAQTRRFFGTDQLYWTIPFAAFGLLRFGQLLMKRGVEESPTETMLRDPPFLVNLGVWAVTVVVIIYVL
jgi:4-hydroxybenzoate polyprenyltransferase